MSTAQERPPTDDPFARVAINRVSAEPYYRQISGLLRDAIRAGAFAAGDLLPSEKDLCARFGVSRPVVRQALDELARAGYAYTVKGKGTFVAEEKLPSHLGQVVAGPERDTVRFRDRLSTRTITQDLVDAPVMIARDLSIGVGEPTLHLRRLRTLDGEPLCVIESYIPVSLVPGLVDEDLTDQSLYDVLEQRYDLAIHDLSRRIEAATVPPECVSLLAVEKHAPCLVVTSLAAADNRFKLEWSRAYYRADRIALEVNFPFETDPGGRR